MSTAHSVRANAAIAAVAVIVFHLIALSSGRISESKGLGYDGVSYAEMVKGRLSDGSANTAVRPFVILLVRIPYALGLGMIQSFQAVNYVTAFGLYFVLALLLERRGLDVPARAVLAMNLVLTIAVSKMLAFYPALVDLGAMAIISAAFYLVATDRARLAAVACVFAAASREFGLAVPLYGMHRAIRQRQWGNVLLYLPAMAVPFLIRMDALGIVPSGRAPLSVGRLAENFEFWSHAPFVTAFIYFAVTVFGGITLLVWLRPLRVLDAMRREPELVTYTGFIVAAAAVGDNDIWRYLAYLLPAAMVLAAAALGDLGRDGQRRVLIVMTLITVLTQRPFQIMTMDLYFQEWFPLYRISNSAPVPADVLATWIPRLAATILAAVALHVVIRRNSSSPAPA